MNKTELEQMFEEYDFTEKQKALLSSIIKKTGATEVKVTPGTRGCRLPQGWKPSQETKSWTLLQEITKEEANQEYFKFKDYWQSLGKTPARWIGRRRGGTGYAITSRCEAPALRGNHENLNDTLASQ